MRILSLLLLTLVLFGCNNNTKQDESKQTSKETITAQKVELNTTKTDSLINSSNSTADATKEIDWSTFPKPKETKLIKSKYPQKDHSNDPIWKSKKYVGKAAPYFKKSDFDSARIYLDSAILSHGTVADYYLKRGICNMELRDYDQAIADYQQCYDLDNTHEFALVNISQIYLFKKEYMKAISFATLSIDQFPEQKLGYYNRGLAWISLGEFESGLDDFSQAIALDPNYAEAYHNRANSEYKLKLYEDAANDWEQAAKLGNSQAQKMVDLMKNNGLI